MSSDLEVTTLALKAIQMKTVPFKNLINSIHPSLT